MNIVPVITGLGLVTPLGRTVDETWQALLAGRSISDHASVESRIKSVPRVSGLAIEAAREAIAQSGWEHRPIAENQTALVVGTSKGPIESWMTPPSPTFDNVQTAAGRLSFGLAQMAQDISNTIPLVDGPRLTLSAACASGLHALMRGAMMIRSGEVSRVLVVAAEASVHPLFLSSFRRLGVLPPPGRLCRPFDQNRQGFLMSEAAAVVCLEADGNQIAPAIVAIENFAMGCDATHLTGSDPQGKTFQRLLKQVVNYQPVDFIHAHGTGTIFNDPVELSAIESSIEKCGEMPIPIYSHKGALGHSLGAAGMISLVMNCLSHATGQIPPNINTKNALATSGVKTQKDGELNIILIIGPERGVTRLIRRSIISLRVSAARWEL